MLQEAESFTDMWFCIPRNKNQILLLGFRGHELFGFEFVSSDFRVSEVFVPLRSARGVVDQFVTADFAVGLWSSWPLSSVERSLLTTRVGSKAELEKVSDVARFATSKFDGIFACFVELRPGEIVFTFSVSRGLLICPKFSVACFFRASSGLERNAVWFVQVETRLAGSWSSSVIDPKEATTVCDFGSFFWSNSVAYFE